MAISRRPIWASADNSSIRSIASSARLKVNFFIIRASSEDGHFAPSSHHMGAFIGGEIYVLCCIGCAKSSEDVASTRRKVVGWRQGLCAEYKKCLNSTARVYLIGGPARMPGIHRKERENRKRKTHLTHTGLLMEGVEIFCGT